jgi:predicted enzyme related to lactoylglutathione lyase
VNGIPPFLNEESHMKSALSWFEIPVVDMDRAMKFYEGVLKAPLRRGDFFGTDTAVFKAEEPGVGGALIRQEKVHPQADGTLVYLNLTGQLDAALGRVPGAGGAVLLPKTSIGDMGEIAIIRDSEGNRVGFHSEK